MSATALLLATRSEGKLRELRSMFAAAGLTLVSLDELEIDESEEENDLEPYATFEENARSKARYFYEVSGGIPTVADDSGLAVDYRVRTTASLSCPEYGSQTSPGRPRIWRTAAFG